MNNENFNNLKFLNYSYNFFINKVLELRFKVNYA